MQRSRLRRNQRVKAIRGRVTSIKDKAQWHRVTSRKGSKVIVALFYAQWNSACKQMRTFFNDISIRPNFAHVSFAELDVDDDEISGIAKQENIAALPTVQFWKDGQCVDVATGGVPMVILELINKHAGPKPDQQKPRSNWRLVGMCVGAGVALLAAGFVAHRWYSARGSEEAAVQRRLQRVKQRIKDVQKSLGGPSKKSRRRGARLKPGSSAELADLFSQQQALTIQLEQLQRGKLGGLARPAAEEDDDLDDEDDLSDDDV